LGAALGAAAASPAPEDLGVRLVVLPSGREFFFPRARDLLAVLLPSTTMRRNSPAVNWEVFKLFQRRIW